MDECRLVKPELAMEAEILAYRAAMQAAGSSMGGTGTLRNGISVAEWLEDNRRMENPETVPPNMVDAEQFVYVRKTDGRIVGMLQFRHRLNDYLASYGGHIGYSVRPEERKKGYAKRMLADGLRQCKALGLTHVLITCKVENEGSRRTMLANGGVYENTVHCSPENCDLQRYWFTL